MNIKSEIIKMKKRINDDDLLKIQKIISEEIERRQIADSNNSFKRT